MTLIFTKNRLQEPAFQRRPNLRNLRPGNYRFARAGRVRAFVDRLLLAVQALLTRAQHFDATAKRRRIEREFRIRGPRHDWLRIDDDHFTPIER
jgi:hypothetical protein